jgi:hypothetical protein
MSDVRIAGGATDEEVAAVLFALTQVRVTQPPTPRRRTPRWVPAPTYGAPLSWAGRLRG